MDGWVKLHRKITDWEWYRDINTKVLYLHCLIKANTEDKNWQGITICRGQFVSSYPNLAEETGLTVGEIRTALDHLKKTEELAVTKYPKFSLFTVLSFDTYQSFNSQVAGNSQSIDSRLTATKELKNNKNKENNIVCSDVITYLNEKAKKQYKENSSATIRMINARLKEGFTVDDFKRVIDFKASQWVNDATMKEYLRPTTLFAPSHFENYLNESHSKSYVTDSNEMKLAKSFQSFRQAIDCKFNFKDINTACAYFESLISSGRAPNEIYAVMKSLFNSDDKFLIKKYCDVKVFCDNFSDVGTKLLIQKKGSE